MPKLIILPVKKTRPLSRIRVPLSVTSLLYFRAITLAYAPSAVLAAGRKFITAYTGLLFKPFRTR